MVPSVPTWVSGINTSVNMLLPILFLVFLDFISSSGFNVFMFCIYISCLLIIVKRCFEICRFTRPAFLKYLKKSR